MVALSASVGEGGTNEHSDVVTVQGALNRLPFIDGGPRRSLVVDGACGQATVAAIERFHLVATGSPSVGRIDPTDVGALQRLGLAAPPSGRLASLSRPAGTPGRSGGALRGRLRLPTTAIRPAPPPRLEVQASVTDPEGDGIATITGWRTAASPWVYQGQGARSHPAVTLRVIDLPPGTDTFQVQTSLAPVSPDQPAPPGLISRQDVGVSEAHQFTVNIRPSGLMKRPASTAPSRDTFTLRVAPIGPDGHPRLPVSNSVTVSVTNVQMAGPTDAERAHRQAELASAGLRVAGVHFEPAKDPDPRAYEYFEVTTDVPPIYKKGQKLHRPPDDGRTGGFEAIGGAVVSTIDFVADSADWVADAWDDIQQSVVDWVADDLLACGDPCRVALTYGMQAALTGLGVPPSIPNFDQLTKLGKGYMVEVLAAELAEQAGDRLPPGMAEELAQKSVDELIKQIEQAASHGSNGDWWLRPDPDKQGAPAAMTATIANTASTPSTSWEATIAHPLYGERILPLPPLRPGQRIDVPTYWDGLGDYRSRWPHIDDSWKTNTHPTKADLLIENWWHAYTHDTHTVTVSLGDPNNDRTIQLSMLKRFRKSY